MIKRRNSQPTTWFIQTWASLGLCLSTTLVTSCGESKGKGSKAAPPDIAGAGPAVEKTKEEQLAATPPLQSILDQLTVDFQSSPPRRITDITNLDSKQATIRPELMTAFCIHSYKLPLKADFNAEIGVLCGPDKKPSPMFTQIDQYTKVDPKNPKALEIANSEEGGFNKSLVISAIVVPIPPKFVKEAKIHEYMAASAKFPYFTQDSKVTKDLIGEVGGDLTFGRYELYYATKNKTDDGKSFSNERLSQFNGYQVQGGNSDIGLGAEHMISKIGDYKYFKTITVTIGNVDGSSTIITIAHVEVNHNGYPKDARRLAIDTATAQSVHVREGVLIEKKDRINPN